MYITLLTYLIFKYIVSILIIVFNGLG